MLEIKPSLTNPAIFFATMGGIGLLPKAPGTWASLATFPITFLIDSYTGSLGIVVFCIFIFFLGIWACNRHLELTKIHDSSHCVIDECLGQSLVILVTPMDPIFYLLAFAYFRFFDIIKIWPTNWLDQNIKGGLGVMLDDVFAAIQAIAVLTLTIGILNIF